MNSRKHKYLQRDLFAIIQAASHEELVELDLSGQSLIDIPEAIGRLTNLRFLDLSNNLLTELPEAIGDLIALEELKLSENGLKELPESFGNLTELQSLNLSDNRLTTLPESFGNLAELQSLNLSDNRLTTLPESFGNLTELRSLDLFGNQLTTLPELFGNLAELQSLNLSDNRLTTLSESFGNLTELRSLDLSSNQLMELPEWLGQLFRLVSLNLGATFVKELPDSLVHLKKLSKLSLDRNQLTSLPESLRGLTNLEVLELQENRLDSVPEWLGDLTNLRVLYLDGNYISSLPESLIHLKYLQRLDLGSHECGGNNFVDLPNSIGELQYLSTLRLDENPLNPELSAAYEQGLYAVKAYLQEKAEDQFVLNEAKLILVGEGEVGKTSLLGALRGDSWVEKRKTTHGVEVDIKSLVVTAPASAVEITLNGWDFGGQNIYRHTHQLFFTSPAIYLAVWNPRRGPEQCRVDEWIKMIKHRAYDETRPNEQPRILVVATHGGPKERLDHIDEQTLRHEFTDLIVGFYHVDSKSGHGLDDLKRGIAQTAASISQVGRSVPASWKRVLDAVRQRSQTDAWITYEQFQILCTKQGIDLVLAKTYAAILNELGHLIHYSTDPVLKDTVILKPEWLSKAISFVLEDKQVKEQNGLVQHDRLSELWDDPSRDVDRYPKHLHSVFLKLMERCDLSYQVELPEAEASPTSLMAQLVPSSRPEGWEQDWVLKPGDTERTQICRVLDSQTGRTVEAEGLMYRLIVRLHRYSLGRDNYYKSRHWKNGMLLDDGFNGRAFIEEIAGDVYITVRAAYPSGFLGHLCSEVGWLVDHFWKGLDPRLFLPCPTDTCKGLLERDEIVESKDQGISKIRCAVCRKYHDIDGLMAAPAAKPEWQDAVTQLNQGQQQILRAVNTNYDSLSVQLRTLMSQADEQFIKLLETLTDPAKDGPRLFSFEPVNPGFWDKPRWVAEKFRLTLWCEHRRLPLPVLDGDDSRGVYEIELTRDWVKRASPLLRILSVTLKLALPIAIPGTKLATNETEYNAITEQLEFGMQSANSFLQGSEKVGDWLVDDDTMDFDSTQKHTQTAAIRAQGVVLRELHALLKAKDPADGFGGLERVRNKRQEFLWVHPQYVDQY